MREKSVGKKAQIEFSSQIFSTENNYFYYKYKGYPAMQKFSVAKLYAHV